MMVPYYYPVRVKTKSRKFDRGDEEAEFVPGMMASVEIIGEARTVAQYMLSRFEVARRSAFTESDFSKKLVQSVMSET